ncbi:UdgX family uracil-DNA binding protein [Geminicoccus roseus]|uniref:UdgX family uracil-DNA binding protein n=1 Tax=Geminicoccus roseus TaxID=404900 RepID=UPI0004887BC7|nr:UdgX family uracil-DNA binding protein [Geminicoccus roseus]
MHRVKLASPVDFEGWRDAARRLALAGVLPEDVAWAVDGQDDDLFAGEPVPPISAEAGFSVPRRFIELARTAICHGDPERFALLYALLRGVLDDRGLIEVAVDPLVARVERMAKAVRRDIHKMHAFVRFRSVQLGEEEHFIAWFEPEHHIVEAGAPFFQRRFASMRWSILTPERCVHWDGSTLTFTDGVPKSAAPSEDALEELWRSYYASIFNPARLKVGAMQSEMPRKYWKNLPEAELIRPLIEGAERRMREMVAAVPTLPNPQPQQAGATVMATGQPGTPLEELRQEAAGCRACPLWAPATQTVFGEGPEDATVLFVGEQPGDSEDLKGRPFVGPAGQLFDRALGEAGIDRRKVYVTNAVKHFKFEPRGKRRIHQKPNAAEVKACRPWLSQELATVRPKLVVALGATAVQSLVGRVTSLTSVRGRMLKTDGDADMMATVHPSFLLRVPDEAVRAQEYARFVDDLRQIGEIEPGVRVGQAA